MTILIVNLIANIADSYQNAFISDYKYYNYISCGITDPPASYALRNPK